MPVVRPRLLPLAGVLLVGVAARAALAQEMPSPQMMQMQVQRIAQERPPQAEPAVREFLRRVARDPAIASLDSLKTASPDSYWQEVAQLMVQSEMSKEVARRDSARGTAMEQMFGIEFEARGLQRGYRASSEADRARIRSRLEQLMSRHFDIESQLMELELADAARRLDAVKGELARRSEIRAERVRWSVDDIVRDALRPR